MSFSTYSTLYGWACHVLLFKAAKARGLQLLKVRNTAAKGRVLLPYNR